MDEEKCVIEYQERFYSLIEPLKINITLSGYATEVKLSRSSFLGPSVELVGSSLNPGKYTVYHETKNRKRITQENVSATYLRQIQDNLSDNKLEEQLKNKFWSDQRDLQVLRDFLDIEPLPEPARRILEDLVERR